MTRPPPRPPSQRGAALMEALVAMLIVAFGVLGFVGLQARTAVSNLEGYQRAQALVLLGDITQRMSINRIGTRDGHYVRNDVGVGTCAAPAAPSPAPSGFSPEAFDTANTDICAWADLIQGAAEKDAGGASVGAMLGARGCITATGIPNEYRVTIVWQGIQASAPAPQSCGVDAYSDENLRRGVSQVVRIGVLG